jgi:hypothetical protein
MRTHFRIFILAATLSIPVLTAILFLGFQAHTDTDIALRLLIRGQSILLILCLAILFGVLAAILFMQYWLKPLNMLDYLSELPPPAPESLYMPAVMDELSATAEIRLHYSGPDNLFIDRMMLFRIFLNLLRNAQDAGAKQMTIDVWQAGHLAVIDISDNGPGIDNSIRDRIFSAFTTGRSSHIGLGLAICLDLALALEGRLSLARTSNEGCAFRLQLPAVILQS